MLHGYQVWNQPSYIVSISSYKVAKQWMWHQAFIICNHQLILTVIDEAIMMRIMSSSKLIIPSKPKYKSLFVCMWGRIISHK